MSRKQSTDIENKDQNRRKANRGQTEETSLVILKYSFTFKQHPHNFIKCYILLKYRLFSVSMIRVNNISLHFSCTIVIWIYLILPQKSTGEGSGNPLRYSCLENPMDSRAWRGTVHGVAKSWTRLSD